MNVPTPYTNERGNRVYITRAESSFGELIWFETEQGDATLSTQPLRLPEKLSIVMAPITCGVQGWLNPTWRTFTTARRAIDAKYKELHYDGKA